MKQTGGKWSALIGAYMVIKGIVNLILGFSAGNVVTLVISIVLAYLLFKGVPYINYGTGAYLAVLFFANLIPNIQGGHFFYLAEGILDAIAAVVLFTGGRSRE